jgi:hypothetical protein
LESKESGEMSTSIVIDCSHEPTGEKFCRWPRLGQRWGKMFKPERKRLTVAHHGKNTREKRRGTAMAGVMIERIVTNVGGKRPAIRPAEKVLCIRAPIGHSGNLALKSQ